MPTKKHCIIMGAAALATVAYFYVVAKNSQGAQSVPVLKTAFNVGYNAANGSFSFNPPAAPSAT